MIEKWDRVAFRGLPDAGLFVKVRTERLNYCIAKKILVPINPPKVPTYAIHEELSPLMIELSIPTIIETCYYLVDLITNQ